MEKIFGVGLSKTGTNSLSEAMRILGYRAKNYLKNSDFLDLSNIDFTNDMPIITRYKSLDYMYPGSKFILTTRSKDSWLKSCEAHWRNSTPPKINSRKMLYRLELYGTLHFDKGLFSHIYDEHHKEVLAYFKNRKSDLLTLPVHCTNKWEILCDFIGKQIPNVEYPIKNKRKR